MEQTLLTSLFPTGAIPGELASYVAVLSDLPRAGIDNVPAALHRSDSHPLPASRRQSLPGPHRNSAETSEAGKLNAVEDATLRNYAARADTPTADIIDGGTGGVRPNSVASLAGSSRKNSGADLQQAQQPMAATYDSNRQQQQQHQLQQSGTHVSDTAAAAKRSNAGTAIGEMSETDLHDFMERLREQQLREFLGASSATAGTASHAVAAPPAAMPPPSGSLLQPSLATGMGSAAGTRSFATLAGPQIAPLPVQPPPTLSALAAGRRTSVTSTIARPAAAHGASVPMTGPPLVPMPAVMSVTASMSARAPMTISPSPTVASGAPPPYFAPGPLYVQPPPAGFSGYKTSAPAGWTAVFPEDGEHGAANGSDPFGSPSA